ncbi:hypothetical protein KC669_04820, partial [Candidatus Dojkabacteria bacterium]|nr:hypothetical protein [Candidatus Dojkabacteria bacterium]
SEPTTISELQNSVPTEDTAIGTDSDLNSPQTISEIIDKKSEEDNNPEEVAAENTSNVLDINTNKNIEASTNVSIDKETKMLFSKIGLIGLKKSNIDTIEFKNVTKTLLGKKYSLILDSAEGLGKSAVEAAKESSSKVTTVYLKSFLNQDEEQANSSDAEISVIYSNYLEKLKHFIKESRVFVFFSLSDIEVLSMFSTVLDLQKIYKNSSKPIVCVGDEWNSIIEQIATLTELTAEDKKNIRVISSINDFDQSLTDIQNQYSSNKNDINMPKVVDRRVEGDEKDLVLY